MTALTGWGDELTRQKQQQPAPAAPAPAPAARTTPAAAPAPPTAPPSQSATPLTSAPSPVQQPSQGSASLPGNPDRDAVSSMFGPAYKNTMQAAYDWTNRYANDAMWGGLDNFNAHMGVGDLATLRARRDAMNAQMSGPAKASADIAAQFTAPQNILLNRVPYFGGALQGGGQAGAQAWFADKDPATIAKETAVGTAAGFGSQFAGQMASKIPQIAAPLAAEAVERAPQTALGALVGHSAFGPLGAAGGAFTGLLDKSAALSAAPYLKTAGDWIRQAGDMDWSAAKPAVRSLLLGLTNTGVQSGLPNLPQWTPPS